MTRTWGVQSGLLSSRPASPTPNADLTGAPERTPNSTPPTPTDTSQVTSGRPRSATERPSRPKPPTQPRSHGAGPIKRVVFRIRPDTRDKIVDLARAQDASYAAILITAITEQAQAGQLVPPPADPPDALFAYTQTRRPSSPTVPIEVRLPETDLITIDRMVAENGWTNRTEMLIAALDRHISSR